jgi:uncharacterized membrane protein YhaH (DUF805 family)
VIGAARSLRPAADARMLARHHPGASMNVLTEIDPLIGAGVVACTAITDAVYVFFNAAVVARRRLSAANWSMIWYLLSAFAVISYTQNPIYVVFAGAGSWLGAFVSITWLRRQP